MIRASSLLVVGRGISMGMNFAAQVAIVRYFSSSDFGAFAYAISIVGFAQVVALFGLDRAISRFVPIYEERGDTRRVAGTVALAFGLVAMIGITTVLVVLGLQVWLGSVVADSRTSALLTILIMLAPIEAIDELIVGLFAAFGDSKSIFFRRYVVGPALRLTIVLVMIATGSDILLLAGGYVAASLFGSAAYGVVMLRVLRNRIPGWSWARGTIAVPFRDILSYVVPLLTSDLLFVLITVSDVVLLEHFGSTTDVAAFRVVQPLALLNLVVFASTTVLFTPTLARLFARNDSEGVRDLYWRSTTWMALVTFPIFAVTFAGAAPVTELLYGATYASSGVYLSILSAAYFFNVTLGLNGVTLRILGRVRYLVVINLLAAAVNIALNLMLIPRWGALGAAVGTSATLAVHNVLKQIGLKSVPGIGLFDMQYVRAYSTIALAALALTFVAVNQPSLISAGLVSAGLCVVVLGLNRDTIASVAAFPELDRIPGVKRLVR